MGEGVGGASGACPGHDPRPSLEHGFSSRGQTVWYGWGDMRHGWRMPGGPCSFERRIGSAEHLVWRGAGGKRQADNSTFGSPTLREALSLSRGLVSHCDLAKVCSAYP